MARKRVVYALDVAAMGMPGSTGRRVECYRLGNWVCMTGQAAFTLDTGKLVGIGDPAAQARQCCENIKTLMERAGAATYPVIRSYLQEPRPCQTGVVVKGLAREDMLIEIDAWGFIDDPE
jgi:enamine deaminase RidA (YjgF/YER057c/UK114 family)